MDTIARYARNRKTQASDYWAELADYQVMVKNTPREVWLTIGRRLHADLARIPASLERDEYEALCAQFGISPVADGTRCMGDIGGEFWVPEYGELEVIGVSLHSARRAAYEAPMRAKKEAELAAWRAARDAEPVRMCGRCHRRETTDLGMCQSCFDND
jgi:hypothetical protein